jgi:hypothetical protein
MEEQLTLDYSPLVVTVQLADKTLTLQHVVMDDDLRDWRYLEWMAHEIGRQVTQHLLSSIEYYDE